MADTPQTPTADLLARLRRHYIKPGAPLPGGVFLPEVGWNGAVHPGRADALYVGLTGSSGRLLVGHEIKVSRADWLRELAKPGKADAWADQCHEWWIVTLPGVIQDGELPDGWGLMLPGTSRTRMKVVTAARRHADRTPSWDAMRSIVSRQDSLRAQAIEDGRRKAVIDAREKYDADVDLAVQRRVAQEIGGGTGEVLAEVQRYREALGGRLTKADGERRCFRGEHTDADLADLAALLRTSRSLADAAETLVGRYRPLIHARDAVARAFDEIQATLDAAQPAASSQICNEEPAMRSLR